MSDINLTGGIGSAAATTVASALSPKATAKDAAATGSAASSSSSDAASDGATITSSDFLTLLVTELKNQDPTQPTDPNAYIQQLVGVNSLQQLISINQDLTPIPASTSTTGT
ncbi:MULTISPECIES: flagellar hook capping FlgD N-terminal domain-containing protein [Acidobacteriaceae]|uniref:flagellar hook assembly protein FlgD n=1 Tax=Acidobacteriaceae TaxID=204434 RepID=UPI00131DEFC3|nr:MULTISPECIES: flagellar hook capping FlgD N-terminal domain-containing protein [Acidobacteriaceae]MDW5264319.1 flagellar hook capping FlgD N-terminal domain-containing protein [Edaphobacter sp.]